MSRKTVHLIFKNQLTAVAESRYNEILSSSDALEIEYEAVNALDVKPTKGVMRIMDLLEAFTGS